MRNVPPSVRAALKRRGADDILNQEGEYADFKPQIDRIIHAGEDMSGYIGDTESFEDYDDDAREDVSPEEKKAEKAIEGYADKYGTGSDDIDARPNETKLRDMNLSDSEMWNMAYQYIGTDKLEKLAEQLDLESPQDIPTNELLKYMSDSDIEDMIRVNGLDDFDDEFYDNDELFDSEYELITEKGEEESKKFREREGVKDVSKLTNEEFNNLARKAMEEYGIKDFALAQEFVVGNESNVLGSEEGHNPDDFKTEFPDDSQKEPHVVGPDNGRYDNPDDYYNSKRIKEDGSNLYYGGVDEETLRKSEDFKIKEYLNELDEYRKNNDPKKEFYERGAKEIENDINARLKQIKSVPNDIGKDKEGSKPKDFSRFMSSYAIDDAVDKGELSSDDAALAYNSLLDKESNELSELSSKFSKSPDRYKSHLTDKIRSIQLLTEYAIDAKHFDDNFRNKISKTADELEKAYLEKISGRYYSNKDIEVLGRIQALRLLSKRK